jgi:hypothetical protein
MTVALCLHKQLPGGGSQQCHLLPCIRSYRLATVSQLTQCSSCRLSTNCPAYKISARTARKHRSSVAVYGPLPSNDRCPVVCFAVVAQQRVYMPRYQECRNMWECRTRGRREIHRVLDRTPEGKIQAMTRWYYHIFESSGVWGCVLQEITSEI